MGRHLRQSSLNHVAKIGGKLEVGHVMAQNKNLNQMDNFASPDRNAQRANRGLTRSTMHQGQHGIPEDEITRMQGMVIGKQLDPRTQPAQNFKGPLEQKMAFPASPPQHLPASFRVNEPFNFIGRMQQRKEAAHTNQQKQESINYLANIASIAQSSPQYVLDKNVIKAEIVNQAKILLQAPGKPLSKEQKMKEM